MHCAAVRFCRETGGMDCGVNFYYTVSNRKFQFGMVYNF